MTFLPHTHTALARPVPSLKRRRRTATSVLAGDFNPRPPRDILTSLLNGVKPYRPPLTEEELREKEVRREKRREREKLEEGERERRRKEKTEQREKARMKSAFKEINGLSTTSKYFDSQAPKDFWSGRPSTSSDVTPDDLSDNSSSISQPSSRRPYTPPDDEMGPNPIAGPSKKRTHFSTHSGRRPGRPSKKKRMVIDVDTHNLSAEQMAALTEAELQKEPKKRVAHRKGWKGLFLTSGASR